MSKNAIGRAACAAAFSFAALVCQTASAATLCVDPQQSACFGTISGAVAAAADHDAIQVAAGTYKEDVTIGKPLSLIASGNGKVVIDATGLANGIYVDGMNNSGLSGVLISGFTVENANLQGILVVKASAVTIEGNRVLNNNRSLDPNSLTCPGLPSFETNEDFDCGEGIHLLGTDHSLVANNFISGNAGGILISDDAGLAAHDNLISGNTTVNNPFDCGITLASHSPAGVYHNTVMGNVSARNGTKVPGAGAGIGLFSPAPVTQAYANVIVNNLLTDNGLPGVALHTHAPGAVLADNVIAGNRISGNGADTEDTATPGTAGINISGISPITGTMIAGNIVTDESIDLAVQTDATVQAHLNSFLSGATGVWNLNNGTVDAAWNWWGCPGGPGAPGCTTTTGSVIFQPFLTHPVTPGNDNNGKGNNGQGNNGQGNSGQGNNGQGNNGQGKGDK